MDSQKFIEKCKKLVAQYAKQRLDVTGNKKIKPDAVYVVWIVKVLQNNKALLSTPLPGKS